MKRTEFNQHMASGPYCFLFRDAERNDEADWSYTIEQTGMWSVRVFPNTPEGRLAQYAAWLRECLATALLHENRTLATRAAFQATQYAGWLRDQGIGGPAYHDALTAAQNRVVSFVQGRP